MNDLEQGIKTSKVIVPIKKGYLIMVQKYYNKREWGNLTLDEKHEITRKIQDMKYNY